MDNFSHGALDFAMIVAIVLLGAAVKLSLEPQKRGRTILMMLAAFVLVMNVMIWTV